MTEPLDEWHEQTVLFEAAADVAEKLNLTQAKDFTAIADCKEGTLVLIADTVSIRMGRIHTRVQTNHTLRWESYFLDGAEIYQKVFYRQPDGEWSSEISDESVLLNPSTVLYM